VPTFRIATFVNDEAQYEEMRTTFEIAGFTEPIAAYERLSDRETDPFEVITRTGAGSDEYVLLAHQDVRCDLGATASDLERTLDELTRTDPHWAVAGNAGMGDGFVGHLDDPNGKWRTASLPAIVASLDENFLILRTARRPHASKDLHGFHLYGSDVCLHAQRDGSRCYVIDFLVTHLSAGNMGLFDEAAEAFAQRWATLLPRYQPTTVGPIPVAHSALVRRVMRRHRVMQRFCSWKLSAGVTRGS
jgi:hypothetical protein